MPQFSKFSVCDSYRLSILLHKFTCILSGSIWPCNLLIRRHRLLRKLEIRIFYVIKLFILWNNLSWPRFGISETVLHKRERNSVTPGTESLPHLFWVLLSEHSHLYILNMLVAISSRAEAFYLIYIFAMKSTILIFPIIKLQRFFPSIRFIYLRFKFKPIIHFELP